jgi:serine/alanine adding enzyme
MMVLDVAPDSDVQWRTFNVTLRNQIRKAEKSGLQFVMGHNGSPKNPRRVAMAFFARNISDPGTPVYSKSFFRNILEAFPDTTRIFAVYHQTRMIAAGIGSWFRNTLEIPWASSISDYKILCLNNMLYWER